MNDYYGTIGILVLILDIWAIVSVISSVRDIGTKVLWICLVLLLPILGFIAWFFMGPRGNK